MEMAPLIDMVLSQPRALASELRSKVETQPRKAKALNHRWRNPQAGFWVQSWESLP